MTHLAVLVAADLADNHPDNLGRHNLDHIVVVEVLDRSQD